MLILICNPAMLLRAADFDLTRVFELLWSFVGNVVAEMKLWTFTLHGHTVSIFSLVLAVFVIEVITSALPVVGDKDKTDKGGKDK